MRRSLAALALAGALVLSVAGASHAGAANAAERHDAPRIERVEHATARAAALPAPAKRASALGFNFYALVAATAAVAGSVLVATATQRRDRAARSRPVTLPRLRGPPVPNDLALLTR